MNVLVTGATGFIGSQIARGLLARGHTVRASERAGASRDRLADVDGRIEWVTSDVFAASGKDLTALCDGMEMVVHSAWYAVPGKYLEAPENLACVSGTVALTHALADAGVKRAVYVGTCFEYDFDFGWLSETTPNRPASLYAAAKSSARLMSEQIARGRDVAFCWVRPFYQYGPFEDGRRLVERDQLAATEMEHPFTILNHDPSRGIGAYVRRRIRVHQGKPGGLAHRARKNECQSRQHQPGAQIAN